MPKPPEQQPQQRGRAAVPPVRLSRLRAMQRDGIEPDLPEVGPGAYLLGHLFEVGPVSTAGMGVGPITWGELQAWQVQTGIELQPWEARTVHRLSRDFAAETRRAEDPAAAAPMRPLMTEDRRAAVADKLRQQYAALRMAAQHDEQAKRRTPR